MARCLLILPSATYRATDFLDAAARLGIEVVTASDEHQALASVMGDHFLELPLALPSRAAEMIVERARTLPLDAVIGVDDQATLTAALASEALGLRTSAPAAVAATTDKAALRARLEEAGCPQPPFRRIEAGPGRAAALTGAAGELGYPVVVKPCTLAASRGVIRADDDAALLCAAARTEAILKECGREGELLLLERYIPGGELAIEALLDRGSLEILCAFDKPDPLEGPYFEETIYVTPSRLEASRLAEAEALVASACAALGLTEGPVHAEVRLLEGGAALLLEVAARTIGGRCARVLAHATGQSLEELVLVHALGGGEVRRSPHAPAAGVMMLPIPASGYLRGLEGREAALAVDHVTGLELAVAPGRYLRALPEGDRYLGFLFAAGPDPATVERALRLAHGELRIEIDERHLAAR